MKKKLKNDNAKYNFEFRLDLYRVLKIWLDHEQSQCTKERNNLSKECIQQSDFLKIPYSINE